MVLIALGTFVYSLRLEPLTGDLTRLGGFSERDYGQTIPERAFNRPMYVFSETIAPQRGRQYDVVIFGDSFSVPQADRATWVDYFAADSGLRILVVPSHGTASLIEYLASPAFHANPPRVVIYEAVTRDLAVDASGAETCAAPPDRLSLAVPLRPTGIEATRETRRRSRFNHLGDRFDTATFTLRQRLLNGLLPALAGAKRVALNRSDLFSARVSDQLLYLPRDVAAQTVSAATSATVICTLSTIAAAVERAGTSRFVFIPALDKSAAYAAFQSPRTFGIPPLLVRIRNSGFKHMADPSPSLKAAIDRGERDIYLPNDTHWGSAGAAVAARSVIASLRN